VKLTRTFCNANIRDGVLNPRATSSGVGLCQGREASVLLRPPAAIGVATDVSTDVATGVALPGNAVTVRSLEFATHTSPEGSIAMPFGFSGDLFLKPLEGESGLPSRSRVTGASQGGHTARLLPGF
jgi:hypothetical protein